MENENQTPKPVPGDPKQPQKRPYHHFHNNHRRNNNQNGQDPATNANAGKGNHNGDAIRTRPRFDLPPEAAGEVRKPENNDQHHRGNNRNSHKKHFPYENREYNKPQEQTNKPAEDEKPVIKESAGENTPAKSAENNQPFEKRHTRGGRNRHNRFRDKEQSSAQTLSQEKTAASEEDTYDAYAAGAAQSNRSFSEYSLTTGNGPDEAEILEELNSVESETAISAKEETEEMLPAYEIVGVRFKDAGKIYYFDPDRIRVVKGQPVIVETSRGLEYGICEIANRFVTEHDIVLPLRKVLRVATEEDLLHHEENQKKIEEAFLICNQKISEHQLGMKLIDVEYTFDNAKLLFYFTAEGRVDFRELVKDLAAVFRTRIELRQIGIRDETKLLGGIGICGRPFCCKTFLSDFVQVSIKMAKEQNLSLNSVKISGACGRLMCCLRYEYDTYQEEIRRTPKVDQIVSTPDGDAVVIETQPLTGLVRVRFLNDEDSSPKVFHRDTVTVIGGKDFKKKESEEKNNKEQHKENKI